MLFPASRAIFEGESLREYSPPLGRLTASPVTGFEQAQKQWQKQQLGLFGFDNR
jgi:hypothetical protein